MNRHERRAMARQAYRVTDIAGESFPEITRVRLDGQWISITSPKLDDFCDPDGNLVLPGSGDTALVIEDWRSTVRQVPS